MEPDAVALAVLDMRDPALVAGKLRLGHQDLGACGTRSLERGVDARGRREVRDCPFPGRLVAFTVHQAAAYALLAMREQRDPERAELVERELRVEQLFIERARPLEVGDCDFTPHYGVLHLASPSRDVRDRTPHSVRQTY